jgi:hypothetical protein
MPRKPGYREPNHPCAACIHLESGRINFLAATGAKIAPLARQFGLNEGGLANHWAKHVSQDYKDKIASGGFSKFEDLRERVVEGENANLDTIEMLLRGHASQWSIALEAGDHQRMVQHAAQCRQLIRLRAELTGAIAEGVKTTTFNMIALWSHPAPARAVMKIMQAIDGLAAEYREDARARIVAALREEDLPLAIDARPVVRNYEVRPVVGHHEEAIAND